MSAATTKSWSSKSNVRRAARKDLGVNAVEGKHFEVVENKDGSFGLRIIPKNGNGNGNGAKPKAKSNGLPRPTQATVGGTKVDTAKLNGELNAKELSKAAAKNARIADAVEKAPTKVQEINHKSTVEGPTALVHRIADEMFAIDPEVRRSTVIAECIRRGIAFYTARTQYQNWYTNRRAKAATKAATKSTAKKNAR